MFSIDQWNERNCDFQICQLKFYVEFKVTLNGYFKIQDEHRACTFLLEIFHIILRTKVLHTALSIFVIGNTRLISSLSN